MATVTASECEIMQAARAVGFRVIDDVSDLDIMPDVLSEYGRDPTGPVAFAIREGRLQTLWSEVPRVAQVLAFATEAGREVDVVLAAEDVIAEVASRASAVATPPRHINEILAASVAAGASDLHLAVGSPPMVRVAGTLSPLPSFDELGEATAVQIARWVTGGTHDEQCADRDIAFCFGAYRFRVNVYRQGGTIALACRALPTQVPSLNELGLPEVVGRLADLRHGLVLVCGPTGSGKSTTLASLVAAINLRRAVHITTIEDPVEYIHRSDRATIHQREIGRDAQTFAEALRSALRQDPDVILVGEMRDRDTIDAALTAAETGHLVLSTLHTGDAEASVGRIVNAFPAGRQGETATRLATVLRAVVCQKLLPRRDHPTGRAVAAEILVNTRAIANVIRNGEAHQLRSLIETGARDGMQTFEQALADGVRAGWLDPAEARASSHDGRSYVAYLSK
ncbi:MAG: type IV pilus twitching motility protein PilT [Acidimicrobiales bacterium]